MKRYAVLLVTILGLGSAPLFAGTMGVIAPVKTWTWVSTVSAGPVWAAGDKTQTLDLAGTERTYVSSHPITALAVGEFFFGIQKVLSRQWQGQLGLGLTATGDAKFQGTIWDGVDAAFSSYNYEYKVQHNAIVLKGKLLLDKQNQVLPWIGGSVGAGFNRAHSFTNTPLTLGLEQDNNFLQHVTNTFTYTLGLGVQTILNTHWQVGAGYEFASWGKSELGRAAGQTSNTGLKINNIYTNGFLFNLTYLV